MYYSLHELMYEEKQLLKGLGSVTRDDAEEAAAPAGPMINGQEILNVKKYTLIVDDAWAAIMFRAITSPSLYRLLILTVS